MTTSLEPVLERALHALKDRLGSNLYSCCLYGSAVRGNFIESVSDFNLLIVLEETNPVAHQEVADAIGGEVKIDPFILGRKGFERSVRAFAAKFASIKRNYRVLFGADPLDSIQIDAALERFLCEQSLRNLRLRMVFAFVTRGRNGAYARFVVRSVAPLFIQVSEVARLQGVSVPKSFDDRIGIFEKQFGLDAAFLRQLLELKRQSRKFTDTEVVIFHQKLFPMVDAVVKWIETNWTQPNSFVSG